MLSYQYVKENTALNESSAAALTVEKNYLERTPNSRIHDHRARKSLPGGDTRWATYYLPYPIYMKEGLGCGLTDVDGNRYIDFQNNYTVLVHGHRPPRVMETLYHMLDRDLLTGAPDESQYILGDILTSRVPGLDTVRFTNSGTEATMMAMRTARAVTGRDLILKMEGGYHGTNDFAQVSITPSLDKNSLPASRTENRGVPELILEGVKTARFNDLESVQSVMKEYGDRIAGIIIEPVMNTAGIVPSTIGFLQGLRSIADNYQCLLIFDEIVTFRLGIGGMQGETGVIPDITVLGKIIGGGFPIGAFGGKRSVMDIYNPESAQILQHSGTFNGHPAAMAAGAAAVNSLSGEMIDQINSLGERLQEGMQAAFSQAGICGHASRAGSLLYVHWCAEEIRDASDVLVWKMKAPELPRLLHMSLLNKGIFSANRGLFNISTAMTYHDIDTCTAAFAESLTELLPYVRKHALHLIR